MTYTTTKTLQPQSLAIRIHDANCPTLNPQCACLEIDRVDSLKYLGVIIDNRLKWDKHAQHTAKRLRMTLYKYRRLRRLLSMDTLRQVYFAITQTIIEYGLLAWGGAYAVHLMPVEVALRSVLRVAMSRPFRYPSALLYTDLDVPTLTNLYIKQLLLFRYKHSHTTDFINHGLSTRQNENRHIRTLTHRTSLFKTCHIYRSVKVFNFLPTSIKLLPRLYRFKRDVTIFTAENINDLTALLRP